MKSSKDKPANYRDTKNITLREISQITSRRPPGVKPNVMPIMDPINPKKAGKKCLVLDLDETLVHSSFQVII